MREGNSISIFHSNNANIGTTTIATKPYSTKSYFLHVLMLQNNDREINKSCPLSTCLNTKYPYLRNWAGLSYMGQAF